MTRSWLHEAANELTAECRGFDDDDLLFIWRTIQRMRTTLVAEFTRRGVAVERPKPLATARKATR